MTQWEEDKHPRDEDGKFTSKDGGTPAEHKRLQELGIEPKEKKEAVQKLAYTLKKIAEHKYEVSKPKMKQLVDSILNFKPIKLKIGDREIVAEFDRYSASKNLYAQGKSDKQGFQYKLANIDKLPTYIESSTYSYTKPETGKNSRQHKGVKEWHYFINKINTNKGVFNITVNVRDKGHKQYVYEVAFRTSKTK